MHKRQRAGHLRGIRIATKALKGTSYAQLAREEGVSNSRIAQITERAFRCSRPYHQVPWDQRGIKNMRRFKNRILTGFDQFRIEMLT